MTTVEQTLSSSLQHTAETLENAYAQLPRILTQVLLSGLTIIVGLLILRVLRRLISRRIARKQDLPPRQMKQRETLRSLVSSVVGYIVYFFVALVVLRIFGIDLTSILAVAGIGSIAIGFGAQTLVKDIISGMFIWLEGNVNVGDIVTVSSYSGRVESITLRTTRLRGTDGSLYAIPNGDIRTVVCRSHGAQLAQVNVTVAHGQDLMRAQEVLQDECKLLAQEMKLKEEPRVLACILNDARCMTLRVEAKCEEDDPWEMERILRLRMFERLRKEEIKP